jgi:hypothetical protein
MWTIGLPVVPAAGGRSCSATAGAGSRAPTGPAKQPPRARSLGASRVARSTSTRSDRSYRAGSARRAETSSEAAEAEISPSASAWRAPGIRRRLRARRTCSAATLPETPRRERSQDAIDRWPSTA